MKQFETVYKTFLADCHDKNLQRRLISTAPQLAGRMTIGGKTYLNVASNDYLGLSFHPKLIEASCDFAKKYGSGSGASRLVTGNITPYAEIEEKIAALKGKQAALVFASGFQANGAVLQALFQKSTLKSSPIVVSDRLNHASMHFGCAAAGVTQKRYAHLSAEQAGQLLKEGENGTPKFCLTETIFSMDGDVAPLEKLAGLCAKHNAMFIADDAHGFGLHGARGEGLGGEADMIIGTFSKACGVFGAYVAASQTMIDYLIQRCSGLIYSTALPPATLGAINAALDLLPELGEERSRALGLAERFRCEMQALGLNTGGSTTQIVPLIVGSAKAALTMSEHLKNEGFWVTAIRPPTVPKGTARLRFTFSSVMEDKDMDKLISCIKTHYQDAEQIEQENEHEKDKPWR